MKAKTDNPGSPAAVAKGCTCPVVDNGRGNGYMGQAGVFVYSLACPIHGNTQPAQVAKALLEATGHIPSP